MYVDLWVSVSFDTRFQFLLIQDFSVLICVKSLLDLKGMISSGIQVLKFMLSLSIYLL